ncbi:hypothetical protein JHFBIEKO_1448 [Methylobacterium mesophilicum]|nr:hypothetical protein JHFBIEKO_1448 [Methylobacterium mesophilicum]
MQDFADYNSLGFPKARPSTLARRASCAGAPVLTDDSVAMNSPLLVSVAVTLTTTLVATLWAILVAAGMSPAPEAEQHGRRDIRTW